jgi:hypothetical protein
MFETRRMTTEEAALTKEVERLLKSLDQMRDRLKGQEEEFLDKQRAQTATQLQWEFWARAFGYSADTLVRTAEQERWVTSQQGLPVGSGRRGERPSVQLIRDPFTMAVYETKEAQPWMVDFSNDTPLYRVSELQPVQ